MNCIVARKMKENQDSVLILVPMRILILITLMFILSCHGQKSETTVTVQNTMNSRLDSVIIRVNTTHLKFMNLKAKERRTQKFSTSNTQQRHDDNAFFISIYSGDSLIRSGTFGYFTHGDIQEQYTITIYDDFRYREN